HSDVFTLTLPDSLPISFVSSSIRSPLLKDPHNVHPVSGLVGDDHQNQAQQLADQVHRRGQLELGAAAQADAVDIGGQHVAGGEEDRKSTRLNSSHVSTS